MRRSARAGRLALAALLVAAAVTGAAAASPAGAADPTPRAQVAALRGPDDARAAAAPANANVDYFGGPVISNVSVHSVYWGDGAYQDGTGPGEPEIEGFFAGITASPYLDWLGEYNENGQTIGRGTYTGQTKITPSAANNGVSIDESNVGDELFRQLSSGALPAPQTDATGNVNTLYGIFFPQGKKLTLGGPTGGVGGQVGGFCAYHSTITFNGLMVPFMVLPDFDDPLAIYDTGCGPDPVLFNNFTAVIGHEMVVAITDPAVGLAFSNGPPLAWYDLGDDPNNGGDDNGEIADLCNEQGPVKGGNGIDYVVQAGWSNVEGDCVLKAPSGYAAACTNASAAAFNDAGLAADCLKLYGVALGKDDGSFGENDLLVRSQVSSFLARLLTAAGTTLSQARPFPDVNQQTVPNTQVRDEIELLAGSGIIAGFPDGTFRPGANLTVAQASTLLVRTLQLIRTHHPTAPDFSDHGATSDNYHYAVATGVLDRGSVNKNGQVYTAQVLDGTARGLLADMLAQAVQRLVTHGNVSPR